ncbi:MAG: hypothetical protein H3C30_10445 [Candidatus Hydrogenedentes bacterium]|nr:hypothetical protein [Candidatus Hydrogenedentota bacterium]
MERFPRLLLAGVFLLTAALGAVQGARVRHLRESEAFFRWIMAAAVNERLFQDDSQEYKDAELFSLSNSLSSGLDELLPDTPPSGEGEVSAISQVSGNYENDRRLWNLARSDEMAKARTAFVDMAKKRELRFAQDIQYAEAQAGGVGIFNLFFGFRKVAANFIWIQVDRFWHQGNMYRMVALMKTCVALDPHFIEAYLIGAWHLAYNATAKMYDTPWAQREWDPRYNACVGEKERYYYLAIDFLKDGIRRNPRNYKLFFDLGFGVYNQKLKDYENAVKYLSEAVRLPHERWVPRQLFISQELNGQFEEALAGWEDYVARFPGTQTATEVAPRRIQRNRAKIAEKRAADLRQMAAATNDPVEAEQLRIEAREARNAALAIWTTLGDKDGDAYRLRLEAIEMREQKRYLEAVALLDKARWELAELWDELSALIMDTKQEAGIPLSVSESKALLRNADAGICKGMPEAEQQKVRERMTKR